MDQRLPFSNRSQTGILDEAGERIVPVGDVCARLGVNGLIRLHQQDYDLVEELEHEYVHFNLEATLNESGKSYAIVPIVRSGHRAKNGEEVVPVLDLRRHRIGLCKEVLQGVAIEQVPEEHFTHSIRGIRTIVDLNKALIERYAPLFPHLQAEQLLLRGCAITRICFRPGRV
jgi:hypothetical protein